MGNFKDLTGQRFNRLTVVGLGKRKPQEIPEIIQSKKRENAGKTLPAQGLFLVKVEYEKCEKSFAKTLAK